MVEEGEPFDFCAERELHEETGILLDKPLTYLCEFKDGKGMFYVYLFESDDLVFPDPKAKDAYEHTEWGYFNIDEKSLPHPISKEITESIIKLKKND